MNLPKTCIVVKNIPAQNLEPLLKKHIGQQNFLQNDQEIQLKIKNTRTFVVFFAFDVSEADFNEILNVLKTYQNNLVSLPELVAVYNNNVLPTNTALQYQLTTTDDVVAKYKLNQGTLLDLVAFTKNTSKPKKWFEIWK
ncbi:hypothetical protein K5I29_01330 [Flavobacterium agricola]|uniref:Uncharacterized protein n=1 Tax=Flavobacterium agricola TaxID=2870839 RepID=A0ABY6LZ40_9FLAO|nr:hypothetical protein [Flavobacterium agricola]UYW01594.1 hypothetical protein K5I29_01330 [Flavobacterium agricola]